MTYLLLNPPRKSFWRSIMDTPDPATARVPSFLAADRKPESVTAPVTKAPRRLLSTMDSAERKKYPVISGCIDYFPDAIAMVSHISWLGNEKHNKGQPLHWARGKSGDHADCEGRHMIERTGVDENGALHIACKAWRALAELQEYLEKEHNLDLPLSATAPGVELPPR